MADAAGLGRVTVFSALGQPLRAEIEVNATKDELPGMAAKIASQEAFKQAGLEYAASLAAIKVTLDKRPSGQPVIRLTSDRPVSDPFIDMLLELNWSAGRLVREYTFLLDPPDAVPVAAPAAAAAPVSAPAAAPVPAEKPIARPVEKAQPKAAEKPEPKPEKKAKKEAVKPEPVAKEAAEPSEKPAGERVVKAGDTLSKIAGELKPEGVALEQMLVGLFRANPDAFQGKNMNRLKTGKILAVPAPEALNEVSAPEARKEVLAQAQDWNAYRRKLAGVAAQEPAAEKPVQKESAGKITAKVEDKAAKPAEAKDQVKVSKSQTPGAQAPAVKKASAEEEKVAREKALKESAERAAQLEKNVADLQKLADLKNKQLAQAQAAAKPAEAPAAPKPAEPAKPVAPVAPEAAKPAAPVTPATPPEAAVPPAAPAPANLSGTTPEAPKMPDAPKPKPKPVAPPPPVEEDDGLGGALMGGLAALLAGVGGLLFYRRRKAKQEGETPVVSPSLSEPSLGANSVFRATGGQSVDTSAATPAVTDFSQTGPGTIDTDEVDPVAEAEVYMAYGRDAQAEEILLEALQKDSKRLAIHLKLLEIYSQRKSNKQFETLATELYTQTGGTGPEWEKAVAMGSKLDPSNPLYSQGGAGAASPFGALAAVAAADAFDPLATAKAEEDPAGSMLNRAALADFALPEDGDIKAEAEKAAANTLSFDLNVGDLPPFGAAPAEPFSASDTVVKAPSTAAEVSDGMALDFDLDLGNTATPSTPGAGKAPDLELGGEDFDFDLKLGDSEIAPSLAMAPAKKTDLSTISLDLGEAVDTGVMDLEKTMLATPEMADAMATNYFGGATSVLDAPADSTTEEQAVATKLDLAKAYEEMGDAEGARELLQEVLTEGNAAQKAAAEAMLDRLA